MLYPIDMILSRFSDQHSFIVGQPQKKEILRKGYACQKLLTGLLQNLHVLRDVHILDLRARRCVFTVEKQPGRRRLTRWRWARPTRTGWLVGLSVHSRPGIFFYLKISFSLYYSRAYSNTHTRIHARAHSVHTPNNSTQMHGDSGGGGVYVRTDRSFWWLGKGRRQCVGVCRSANTPVARPLPVAAAELGTHARASKRHDTHLCVKLPPPPPVARAPPPHRCVKCIRRILCLIAGCVCARG